MEETNRVAANVFKVTSPTSLLYNTATFVSLDRSVLESVEETDRVAVTVLNGMGSTSILLSYWEGGVSPEVEDLSNNFRFLGCSIGGEIFSYRKRIRFMNNVTFISILVSNVEFIVIFWSD